MAIFQVDAHLIVSETVELRWYIINVHSFNPSSGNILVGGQPVCDDGHSYKNAFVVCRFCIIAAMKIFTLVYE